ncbi:S8 family serine peptidase [Sinimarinibacterium sp. CAU 1509]|uniref:S8 family serine peptidase n=1 Tax=Sinimarinibacterium sp. CAU 1509 TaxID=2562283 RepID=UPI001B7FEE68|nr:S8 family serine peptidase [Sinimarinibacterium sp. CAU 1509]
MNAPLRILRFLRLCSLSLACVWAWPASAALPLQGSAPLYRADEILVGYRNDLALNHAKAGLSPLGLTLVQEFGQHRTALMRIAAMTDVKATLDLLRADPDIAFAEPNYLRARRSVVPNDPLFDLLWGLRSTGQANFVPDSSEFDSIPGADLNMIEAWDANGDGVADRTGDGSVVVAIIDDAFNLDHPDLKDNFIAGRDLTGRSDNNPSPDDASLQDHGTLVAGSLGAVGNNGIGVTGTIWNVKMMPLKVGQIVNGAVELDTASIIQAYDYARLHGAKIINASFGGPSYSQAEVNALHDLADADVLFVTSAGNHNANLDDSVASYPANYDLPNILNVAATNRQDNVASFSQFGPISTDVGAPGLQIVTTTVDGGYSTPSACGDGGSCGVSGTSFAAPYTAGIAALIRGEYPNASAVETRARLIEGASAGVDGADAGQLTASGRVDAAASLDLSARPSILIRSVDLVDDGNHRLDPGETLQIKLTLDNIWLGAADVAVTLEAPSDAVEVLTPTVVVGPLASGANGEASFSVQVLPQADSYREVVFTATIKANAGTYSVQRHFLKEIAPLRDGVSAQSQLSTGLHDEFHTYHFDLAQIPEAGTHLTFRSLASRDIDLLIKQGTPAQYDIDLGADAADDPTFFTDADEIGGDESGNEIITLCTPEAGTYYVTVVNYSLEENLDYRLTAAIEPDSASACGAGGGSGGGGALSPVMLILLSIGFAATTFRRRLRLAA